LIQSVLSCEREGHLALLKINYPPRRNALGREVLLQLKAALVETCQAEQIGAVVIGSAVEGTFVSGGDVRELRQLENATEGLQFAEAYQQVFKLVEDFPHPVIAAINGYALGAGAELAVAADIRVAADTAVFSFAQVLRGIVPGFGGGQRLMRLAGPGAARRLILTGDMISAQEALRLGLVEFVVPLSELWRSAIQLANKLAEKTARVQALAKRALNYASHSNLEAGCAYEAELFGLSTSCLRDGS
jgi:enoyl-CoA hydratase